MPGVAELYTRHAAAYDRARRRDLFEYPYLERITEVVPAPDRVLDLGCGGGEPMAQYFVERGYQVTGVDVAMPMINLCRARFPEMNWIWGDMRRLSLSQTYGLVLAWDSLFHLSRVDQRVMFPLFRQLTTPRGLLVFTSGTSDGVSMGDLCGEPLYHASLDPAEYRNLLEENRFSVLLHRTSDPNCGDHTIWVAQRSAS